MSFIRLRSVFIRIQKNLENKKIEKRKETDKTLAHPKLGFFFNTSGSLIRKRTSAVLLYQKKLNASLSVEASLVIPLFFFAALSLTFLLEIMAIQIYIRAGIHDVGKEQAQELSMIPFLQPAQLEKKLVESIGAERLNRSIIVGGSSGLHMEKSVVSPTTAIGHIEVEYSVRLPIPIFGSLGMEKRDSIKIKGWTGYQKEIFSTKREDTVYITEHGLVYHTDYHCTHLELSISGTSIEALEGLRNESGGKYYPCERCGGRNSSENVYITKTGDRYHGNVTCSGLKRMIKTVPVGEVVGRGACKRCGQ